MNFGKFLRTSILENTPGRMLLANFEEPLQECLFRETTALQSVKEEIDLTISLLKTFFNNSRVTVFP